ncbi:hypothetical protein L1987_20480 [Smallanthus sonchifolius]|uniref:Uncharacterized protein n=1 Tax=Smallanthus sonchifolius TaxID=185202 RepID=A0ACB9ISQ0_9ASTR|nr:hypothetical protein L1987_20480 [Smallanthus sonchifolius]
MSDRIENNRSASVLVNNVFEQKKWKDIQVGEIIKFSANETIPCDVVLSTNGCFLRFNNWLLRCRKAKERVVKCVVGDLFKKGVDQGPQVDSKQIVVKCVLIDIELIPMDDMNTSMDLIFISNPLHEPCFLIWLVMMLDLVFEKLAASSYNHRVSVHLFTPLIVAFVEEGCRPHATAFHECLFIDTKYYWVLDTPLAHVFMVGLDKPAVDDPISMLASSYGLLN